MAKFKKLLTLYLSFILLTEQTLMAAISIEPHPRSVDLGYDIKNSMVPSDLPVAGYEDFFDNEVFNIAEKINLSDYVGMKPFVGYGVYDKEEYDCQHVEIPGKDKADFDAVFTKYTTFEQNSYGMSSSNMNFNDCKNLAATFGGTVAVVDSLSEGGALGRFSGENFWIGAHKNSCSDYDYISELGRVQFYNNFSEASKTGLCSESKRYIKSNKWGVWDKTTEQEFNRCIVEFDTPVYYRPLKVCAPWWKIIRDYDFEVQDLYNKRELDRINQADIPQTMNVCIKYTEAATQESLMQESTRDVTCTSYYSMIPSKPECTYNIKQDQCFIDECGGYIKNVCRLKDEEIAGKGYIKGEIIHEGKLIEVKIKDDVKTHVFTCPPSPPSDKFCEEKAKVIVFPEECPGSRCDARKECILKLNTGLSKEVFDAGEQQCIDEYPCEKVYPDSQIPPILGPDGTVHELTGICKDGTQVGIPPNILDKQKKTCKEYEEFDINETYSQRCVLEKTFTDVTVNVALNETDIYQDDVECVRTDKAEDAQIQEVVTMNITANDHFKSRISKVFIDGTVDLLYDSNQYGNYLLIYMYGTPGVTPSAASPTENCNIGTVLGVNFALFDNVSFHDRNLQVLYNATPTTIINELDVPVDDEIPQLNINTLNIVIQGTVASLSSTRCAGIATEKGFDAYRSGTPVYTSNTFGVASCTIPIKKIVGPDDSGLQYIKALTSDTLMYGFGTQTKQQCLIKAVQLDGVFNENLFTSDWSSTATCVVTSGETPQRYMDYLESLAGCAITPLNVVTDDLCGPLNDRVNISTTMDGLTSILAIEDYLDGVFGFNTNFRTKVPKENNILLTSIDYSDAEVYPLVPIPQITDYQKYVSSITHWASRSKTPDGFSELLMMGTSGSSGSPNWIGAIMTGVGLVVIIIVALLTPTVKMNKQKIRWAIYKQTPNTFLGNYDFRYYAAITAGGVSIPNHPDYKIYEDGGYTSGRFKPDAFLTQILNFKDIKEKLLLCDGWERNVVDQMFHASEKGIITGYPKCKWYNPWCEKTSVYNWTHNVNVSKPIKNSFVGGDQSLVLILPYQGDFIFKAFDKNDNLLGEVIVGNNEFAGTYSTNSLKFARVTFGVAMNLSPNVNNACVRDEVVEWGGGVSGGYYENGTTGTNTGCGKSDDVYVKEHAMTRIEIQPVTMLDQSFSFELTKPLPYANRIFAATLDKEQLRHYRCYNDFVDCADENFSGE